MRQLDLCLYQEGTLAEAIYWSLRNTCDHIQPATMIDYQDRARWLLRIFGYDCQLTQINYTKLLTVSKTFGPHGRDPAPLMMTTIKRRFVFLFKVMSEAHGRGIMPAMPMFPKLRSDGRARKRVHTDEQFVAMRKHLDPLWQTWVTIGWETGMHSFDLNRARENWFRLDDPYRDTVGNVVAPGRWLRHNHKTDPNDEDLVWLPMSPDFHGWMSSRVARGAPTDKVSGRCWKAAVKMGLACEKADVPRISPIDLRRSRATILAADGHTDEFIRIWLGHKGVGWTGPGIATSDGIEPPPRKPARPSIRTGHYYRPNVRLIAGA